MQEFERMSQPGYHLTKVRDFYILTIDRAHANNIRHAQALKSALVELSHEEVDGSSPSPANSGKLFPAMEERSLSLPNIMPMASPGPASEGPASRALELGAGGSGGGGISSDENRPRSGSDDKLPKEHMTEEMRSGHMSACLSHCQCDRCVICFLQSAFGTPCPLFSPLKKKRFCDLFVILGRLESFYIKM